MPVSTLHAYSVKTLKSLLLHRSYHVAAALLVLFSLVCTQIPLFNYLGFEFSALLALLAGFLAGLIMIGEWGRSGGSIAPVRFFAPVAAAILLMLVPPLVIMLLNAFLVKNCSPMQGLFLFLLLPVPAVLFTGSMALLIAVLLRRWRKTWYTIAGLIVLAHIAIVTFGTAQIFAFNPIIGYFPGVTYDESLDVLGRLGLYRLTTLVAGALFLVFAASVFRSRVESGSGFVWTKSELRMSLIGALFLFAAIFFSDTLGFSSSESFIRNELGGALETEHFILTYPAEKISRDQAEKLGQLHEFYFFSLVRELRVVPTKKIRSFLYASPEQKGRLIGASGTNISKPWLWQLHVNLRDVDAVLKHEMVHVIAAEFGFPLLRVSVNSGLIEGLATAMERVEYDETLHSLAAQIYSTGLHPDVRSLFSPAGFLKAHGGTSYVIAGSFCRYLIDQYGTRRFKWLYRTGSFESFYNKSLDALIAEWRRHIDRYDPTRQERLKGAYLFLRPSIFGKECARVIANLNAETRMLLGEKRFEEAAKTSERSLALTTSPEAILQHATALTLLKRYQDAIQFSFDKLQDSTVAHVLLPLYITMGDAYWGLNLYAEAHQMYEVLYAVHLSQGWDEAAGIRMAAVSDPQASRTLKDYFLSSRDDSLRIAWLDSIVAIQSHSALLHYLQSRELMRAGKYQDAVRVLGAMPGIDSGILEFSRYRMLARTYFEIGDFQKAKIFFWESMNFTSKPAHKIQTDEWLARCDWMEENAGEP